MPSNTPTTAAGLTGKVVVILLDSLNRHLLGAYGSDEFDTPNLDRLAARSVRFSNHYTGSLPCLPARHDILVGALDFLWKPWGSIELWERPITYQLRRKNIPTVLITDHPHLFETGGENYHTDFAAWDYLRGHEGDPWKTRADPSWAGTPAVPAADDIRGGKWPSELSRTWFRSEADFPGPRTMAATADWLEQHAPHHDEFLVFVDEFDPHEPFDTPKPWAGRYDPDWDEPTMIWPPYAIDAVKNGVITERQGQHVRANYGSKLSMIDHWLGKVLDVMDKNDLWQDTTLILCTDHGHYLGERDIFGKPGVPNFEPIGHTPLFVAAPGVAARECGALTTNVDINATLRDIFAVDVSHITHGHSLMPLVNGTATSIREWAIGGTYGQWVQIQDGTNKLMKAPVGDGLPLSMWSNRWSTMPIPGRPGLRLPNPDKRATLDFMPGSDIPVIRQPFRAGDLLPFWAMSPKIGDDHVYVTRDDPGETENRIGEPVEKRMIEMLHVALTSVSAPSEQFERLGIA